MSSYIERLEKEIDFLHKALQELEERIEKLENEKKIHCNKQCNKTKKIQK